jgi:serine protease Do
MTKPTQRNATRMIAAGLLATTFLAAPFAVIAAKRAADAPVRVEQTQPAVDFSTLIKAVRPSVVRVIVEKSAMPVAADGQRRRPDSGRAHPFQHFFNPFGQDGSPGTPGWRKGQGSGFFISSDGYIVTNDHVIDGAEKITVKQSDGTEFPAELVGRDAKTDLALLKVEGNGFAYVAFGDSDKIEVGQWVVTVGAPFGLGSSANAGIVSARGRDIGAGPYDDFLQIDAPINSGNSGGPAFNLSGEVIGVNTAILSPSGGNVGIGFAIPAKLAADVIADLKDDGSVERGWLGVSIQPLTENLAKALNRSDRDGALVSNVFKDTPAQRAGLAAGDLIIAINGQAVESARDLSRAVAAAGPNKSVTFKLFRGGAEIEKTVSLGKLPGTPAARTPAEETSPKLGFSVFDRDGKVMIGAVAPGSKAAAIGIRPGTAILAVAGKKTNTSAEVEAAITAARRNGEKTLMLWLESQHGRRFFALDLEAA